MRELEALTRRYTAEIIDSIGPDTDVPAPDVNTNEQVMAWIMDTYSMHVGHTVTAVVTGKPVEMGGSLGRREATGAACMIVTREAAKHLGIELKGTTVAVQGFGNVGSVAAQLLARAGCKIVAISDWTGGIYNPKGLDVDALIAHVSSTRRSRATGRPSRSSNGGAASRLDVDVLLPAALENEITDEERGDASAPSSSAKAPTVRPRPRRTTILDERGVFVIPDILANAGGVTVSYFEWVQDRDGYFWTEKEVNERLEAKMCQAFEVVLEIAQKYNVDMRAAAYIVAINRVATVTRLRGMYA